jgi:hypothetical protein
MTEHKKTGAQVEGIHLYIFNIYCVYIFINDNELSQLNVYGRFYVQMHVAYKAQGSRLDFFLETILDNSIF